MFRLIFKTGQLLRDKKPIGRVRRLDGGKYLAAAGGQSAEGWSAEWAAEACCRKIDRMEKFVVEDYRRSGHT